MKGPPLGWQLQAVPHLPVKIMSLLAVPFSRSPRQSPHKHFLGTGFISSVLVYSTLFIPVSAVETTAGVLWPVRPYPFRYMIPLIPTVHSAGAATSGLFCQVVSLASPHRSPAVRAPVLLPMHCHTPAPRCPTESASC